MRRCKDAAVILDHSNAQVPELEVSAALFTEPTPVVGCAFLPILYPFGGSYVRRLDYILGFLELYWTQSQHMDYLRTLGSAAVSSLVQKSGLTLPFSLGQKVASFEGKSIWTLYEATKRVGLTFPLH